MTERKQIFRNNILRINDVDEAKTSGYNKLNANLNLEISDKFPISRFFDLNCRVSIGGIVLVCLFKKCNEKPFMNIFHVIIQVYLVKFG